MHWFWENGLFKLYVEVNLQGWAISLSPFPPRPGPDFLFFGGGTINRLISRRRLRRGCFLLEADRFVEMATWHRRRKRTKGQLPVTVSVLFFCGFFFFQGVIFDRLLLGLAVKYRYTKGLLFFSVIRQVWKLVISKRRVFSNC